MAEERRGSWFGFGFCGFGQAPGSGRGRQVLSPEPLQTPGSGADVRRVSASWSYTALVTRGGQVRLSGAAGGAAGGCSDAWASETLLVVLRAGPGRGAGPELQAWAPASAMRGEPLWARALGPEAEAEDAARGEPPAGALPLLPLLPGARAYVSPRPPFCRALAPELRARRLELGAEHALLLDEAGQARTAGPRESGGRAGAEAAGGAAGPPRGGGGRRRLALGVCERDWGYLYLGLERIRAAGPALQEPGRGYKDDSEGSGLNEDGSEVKRTARGEDGAPAPFIAIQPFPALLDLPLGADAVKASCGSRHTAVVTGTGELYTWGWGKYGQLGHKDTTSLDRPCRVEYFVDKQLQVRAVSCGPWNTYVYAVEKEGS
uniref:RCC1 domain-containing protein 1 isoform X2 n=1 Tax=Nyctereutes procyonoides TaxID=34880 RepID=UPI0024444CD8|nr:RCC1 domain-containing protein 1 isoform X2 [Nyctereutes procyonoides]